MSCYYDTHLPISAPPSTKALLRQSRWSEMERILLPNTFTTQNSITNTHQYLASTQASLPAELRLMDIVNYGTSLVTFPLGRRPAGRQTGIICACGWVDCSKNTLKRKREIYIIYKHTHVYIQYILYVCECMCVCVCL